jgi:hypothetical protein
MSGSKRIIGPFKSIDSVSLATNITGQETAITGIDSLFLYVEWTGTDPVGELVVEFLKTPSEKSSSGLAEWVAIDFGATIAISGNSGSHTIVFSELPFLRIRPRYIATSGTGNLTVTTLGKEG